MQNVPKLLVISLIVYSVVILGMHKTHKKKSFSYAATSKKKKKVKRTRTDKTMAEFTKSRDALLAELHYLSETGKKLYLKRKAVLIDYARQYQQAHETLKRQGISTPNIYDLWKTSDEEGQRWYYDYTNSIMTAIGGY